MDHVDALSHDLGRRYEQGMLKALDEAESDVANGRVRPVDELLHDLRNDLRLFESHEGRCYSSMSFKNVEMQ